MKGILVGSGQNISLEKLKNEALDTDYLIAIDGGMDHIVRAGLRPNIILGDLDSVSEAGLDYLKKEKLEKISYPKEKDYTDMEIGIFYLADKKVDEIVIFGGTGTRLDHSLGNIFLLNIIDEMGIEARIEDSNNTIMLVDSYKRLEKRPGYISVLPINEAGIKLSLKGFKYPLDHYEIAFGKTIGISNEIVDSYGEIIVHRGRALVFLSKD